MGILRDKRGQSIVEWLVGAFLVIAVVGSIVYAVSHTTSSQGQKTDDWIGGIPDPTTP